LQCTTKYQYPCQNFTVPFMSLSSAPSDEAQTNSSACAQADQLVFKVSDAAL